MARGRFIAGHYSCDPQRQDKRTVAHSMTTTTNGNSLAGKLALVTGASRGIGAAIARRLAADGAAVLVHYANSPDKADAVVTEIRKAGGQAEAVGADLADANGPATLAKHIDSAFGGTFGGRLDVLVNNAGVGAFGPPAEVSDEELTKVIQVNFRAVFELARDAARRMTKAKSGRIITVDGGVNA
jgi:3-oxoacyl-[acyl-carrier protein] reductase